MNTAFKLLAPAAQKPQSLESFHTWNSPGGSTWLEFYRFDDEYLLRFPGLADFTINRHTDSVSCLPVPGTSKQTINHLFTNQVHPLLLSKRGGLVFHASAVEVNGMGVIFVGPSGRGKSTLATSFALNGYACLTDDSLVLEQDDKGYQIQPSHPSIRLWRDSEHALILPGVHRAAPLDYTTKAQLIAGEDLVFSTKSARLRQVFFLGEGESDSPQIEKIKGADALMEWVKSSYMIDIEARDLLTLHLDQVAELAKLPIHYRLDYPRDYAALDSVRAAILAQLRQ